MWKTNLEVRNNFLKSKGYEKDKKRAWNEFLRIGEIDEKYLKLRDIPMPFEYTWIWKHFLNIWRNSEYDMMGNVIFTYKSLNEYVECMKVPLTVEDKKMLFKMKDWAFETISEVKKKE